MIPYHIIVLGEKSTLQLLHKANIPRFSKPGHSFSMATTLFMLFPFMSPSKHPIPTSLLENKVIGMVMSKTENDGPVNSIFT